MKITLNEKQMERFNAGVKRGGQDDCWEWMRARQRAGYGALWVHPKLQGTHRIAYCLEHGEIPDGMDVLHKCDNPPCCNPAHLFHGTADDNIKDMRKKHRDNTLRGEDAARAILTERDVVEIRARYVPYKTTQAELAKEYGVARETVRSVVKNESWRHIP